MVAKTIFEKMYLYSKLKQIKKNNNRNINFDYNPQTLSPPDDVKLWVILTLNMDIVFK